MPLRYRFVPLRASRRFIPRPLYLSTPLFLFGLSQRRPENFTRTRSTFLNRAQFPPSNGEGAKRFIIDEYSHFNPRYPPFPSRFRFIPALSLFRFSASSLKLIRAYELTLSPQFGKSKKSRFRDDNQAALITVRLIARGKTVGRCFVCYRHVSLFVVGITENFYCLET